MIENVGESNFTFELVLGMTQMCIQDSVKHLLRNFSAKIVNDEKPLHCVKSAHIRSFSGLHFPAFRLNTNVNFPKTGNTNTFYAVLAIFTKDFHHECLKGPKYALIFFTK